MKFLIILLILIATSCVNTQSQQSAGNSQQSTSANSNNNQGEDVGYTRFTSTDKQYLGCWKSVQASEVINYSLKFFQFTEKTIQTSKMPKPISYREIKSNNNKDYFVLKADSKNNNIQPYLSINIVSDKEMTVGEFKIGNMEDSEQIDYWNLARENCNEVLTKFKK